LSCLSFVF
jgi:dual specificity protein kinase YAK1